MVQPQLVLSEGGPSTLASLRIKMRLRQGSLLMASRSTHGQKEIDAGRPDSHFKWLFSRAIQFSDEHLEHTGQSLLGQTKSMWPYLWIRSQWNRDFLDVGH